jgi:hypothetical protein
MKVQRERSLSVEGCGESASGLVKRVRVWIVDIEFSSFLQSAEDGMQAQLVHFLLL